MTARDALGVVDASISIISPAHDRLRSGADLLVTGHDGVEHEHLLADVVVRQHHQVDRVAQLLTAGDLVFTSVRGRRIDVSVVSKMVARVGIDAVPHGFRSSFRDWASERTDHPREVVEAALAHTVRDQTEAAYARSDLFERRRHLMDDWADYLKAPRGQVVALGW